MPSLRDRLSYGCNMPMVSASGRRQGGMTAGLGVAAGPAWPMGTT
jgi:hypothetical protein